MDRSFSDAGLIRQIPASVDAEQALLGAIVLDIRNLDEAAELLRPEDFYLEVHQAIFATAMTLRQTRSNVDAVILLDELVKNGVYQEAAGREYLKQIAELSPASANVKDYAQIIRDKSMLRKLIAVSEQIREAAYEQGEEAQKILDSSEQLIYDLNNGRDRAGLSPIYHAFNALYARLDLLKKKHGALGIMTHFSDLDRLLNGMEPGDLILIGARPGMGKTSFAMNIAAAVARNDPRKVAIFSIEMSPTQLAARLAASEARIDSSKLRTGDLSQSDFDKLAESVTALCQNQNLLLDETTSIRPSEMFAKLRRVKDLGLVVIDYLQLMDSDASRKNENKAVEVAEITRSLKIMASQLQVPIILCSQLSRANTKRSGGDKRPQLSDLRDSGAIEQDADAVIFLHSDEYYDFANRPPAYTVECLLEKNRHGATGKVELYWESAYTRFSTVEKHYDDEQVPPENG